MLGAEAALGDVLGAVPPEAPAIANVDGEQAGGERPAGDRSRVTAARSRPDPFCDDGEGPLSGARGGDDGRGRSAGERLPGAAHAPAMACHL